MQVRVRAAASATRHAAAPLRDRRTGRMVALIRPGPVSKTPPADELDLVVVVAPALRAAGEVDALEEGAREVVAEREGERAWCPPEAHLGLEVVHPEEGLTGSRGIGDQGAGDGRPIGV